jgi:hypothetical protein
MLTKSDYLKCIQCPRQLWLYKKRKDLLPGAVDLAQQKVFDDAREVEEQAYRLFPEGVNAGDGDFNGSIVKTEELVRGGQGVLFQPSFSVGALYCRSDIMVRGDAGWDIIEVKSSTKVKDYHLDDLAFQREVFKRAGLKVGNLKVMFVNGKYVRRGGIDPAKLIKTQDVTAAVGRAAKSLGGNLEKAFAVMRERAEPDVRILKQCSDPYDCPFISHCWRDIPEHSIYNLGFDEDRLNFCLDRGILRLEDVPDEMVTDKRKHPYYDAVKSGLIFSDRKAIGRALKQLEWPIHHLDYETYSSPVPPFDGYRPYQEIPFQFSVHIQDEPGAALRHEEFLAGEFRDPVPELAEALKRAIGGKGSVLAWYAKFEAKANDLIASRLPAAREFIESVNSRLFDPYEIFKKRLYVDGRFHGSSSLKEVLPVLVPGMRYSDLDVQHGGEAQALWPKLCSPEMPPAERGKLRRSMLDYCAQDTLGMAKIVDFLLDLAK